MNLIKIGNELDHNKDYASADIYDNILIRLSQQNNPIALQKMLQFLNKKVDKYKQEQDMKNAIMRQHMTNRQDEMANIAGDSHEPEISNAPIEHRDLGGLQTFDINGGVAQTVFHFPNL